MIAIDSKPTKITGKIRNFVRLISVKSFVYPGFDCGFQLHNFTQDQIRNIKFLLVIKSEHAST